MSADAGPSTRLSLLFKVRDPQDSVAWRNFEGKYGPLIISWCKAKGLQEADAQDVSQGILLKLLEKMQEFEYDATGSFRKWLSTVTRNAIMDFWRKEGRRLGVGTGDSNVKNMLNNAEDSVNELVEQLESKMEPDLLQEAEEEVQTKVSAQTWAAYKARKNGDRARQIADKLDMSLAAVHKAFSRVKQMIRDELKGIMETG